MSLPNFSKVFWTRFRHLISSDVASLATQKDEHLMFNNEEIFVRRWNCDVGTLPTIIVVTAGCIRPRPSSAAPHSTR
ncbi:hypothetical protein CEXT_495381 [Caerostris extrusa]|uniref:Uncharacterized protein n=1 Tax=Caerostris extrusa TaxID=172846 RepID=A0AAV4SYD2_CAEEX|nr:hypothetical protein CEXT_495381 [Caerostris extrusa]